MAAYNAERKGQNTAVSTTGGIYTFSPASNCGAGNTLTLVVTDPSGGNRTVTQVTDSAGNTWTVDKVQAEATASSVSICSCLQDVATLTTSDTISITQSSTGGQLLFWLEEFTGQYELDKPASNTGTGTSLTTGTTATTTSTDAFAIAGFSCTKSGGGAAWTWTKDANFSNFTTGPATTSSTRSGAAHYRILSATGTYSATDSVNNTTNHYSAAIAVYKAVVAGGTTYTKAGHGVEHG